VRIEPGRIAVVTGGASGIGFALAAAARLRGTGASLTAVVADVSRVTDIERIARTAFELGCVQLCRKDVGE
jgi:NAD(P)-dependent dehydrogenase (short-subunit alcohol dehydrogenase family)